MSIYCEDCRRSSSGSCPAHNTRTFGEAALMAMMMHRHAWRYDGTDGPYYVYHCDEHDPPVIRRVWQTAADGETP